MSKPILLLDFDGVCHSYVSGWQGATEINDPPVPFMFNWLWVYKDHFEIHVLSSRSNEPGGIYAMQAWFGRYWREWTNPKQSSQEVLNDVYPQSGCPLWIHFPKEKPAAFVTLDDRAITFTGRWPQVDELKNFKPWYKSGTVGGE